MEKEFFQIWFDLVYHTLSLFSIQWLIPCHKNHLTSLQVCYVMMLSMTKLCFLLEDVIRKKYISAVL